MGTGWGQAFTQGDRLLQAPRVNSCEQTVPGTGTPNRGQNWDLTYPQQKKGKVWGEE